MAKQENKSARYMNSVLKSKEVHCCFCELHALAKVDGKPYCSACIETMLDTEYIALSDVEPLDHVKEHV